MSNKSKRVINNILPYVGCIFFISAFIYLFTTSADDNTTLVIFGVLFGMAFLFLILWILTGKLWEEEIGHTLFDYFNDTTSYKIKYKNFEELAEEIDKNIKSTEYELRRETKIEDGLVKIYTKPVIDKKLDIIVITYVHEFTKDMVKIEQNVITDYLTSIYTNNRVKEDIKILKILCVDKISVPFKKYASCGIDILLNRILMQIGIVFEDGILHINECNK